MQKIIKYFLKLNPRNSQELSRAKRQIAKKFRLAILDNTVILKALRQTAPPKKIIHWEKLLRKREVRTLSGVAVIAVMTKPYPCPGECVYCPTESKMPKSYLSNEPAVMRAIRCKFDPYRQVQTRLDALKKTGHPTDKIELIVMGGTWSCLPRRYQTWFIKRCFEACNNRNSKLKTQNLLEAQKINETVEHRIIGLTLETRPDYITPEEIRRMRELGCTRVEMGVQAISDSILKLNKRGHNVKQIIEATRLLKDAGLKVAYHLMPNLPGATPAKDLRMFRELFSNQDFQPDMLKIYPCVVVKNSALYHWWKQGKYKPYSDKQLLELLIKMKSATPPYVRIIRLIRDIPAVSIETGNKISNLREIVREEMAKRGLECKCLRCREVGHQKINRSSSPRINVRGRLQAASPTLFTTKYKASGSTEYFLSFESKDKKILYAFCRLRLPDGVAKRSFALTQSSALLLQKKPQPIFEELKGATLIRELHTYGHLVPIAKHGKVQHTGFGKKLMKQAEKIAKGFGYKKIAVIAGIGVREYYRQLGYSLKGTYMVKYFKD